MPKLTPEDYESIIGKEVIVNLGQDYVGIVINCDYDLGLTIVEKDDPTEYLLCTHGPLSTKAQKDPSNPWHTHEKKERQIFDNKIRQIMQGRIDIPLNAWYNRTTYASSDTCPFNQ